MSILPESLFLNTVWSALHSEHRRFAVSAGKACRYPAEVAPFAAVAEITTAAFEDLRSLLAPGDVVWVSGHPFPPVDGLKFGEPLPCFQMALPGVLRHPSSAPQVLQLAAEDIPDMVTLTNIAFPEFFRRGTPEMGAWYGIRHQGELIAMGGERFAVTGFSEMSAICTHPDHRGKGLAAAIMARLAGEHHRSGHVSFLHTGTTNPAAALYHRLGFETVRTVVYRPVSLKP